jgi:hypothetical protein
MSTTTKKKEDDNSHGHATTTSKVAWYEQKNVKKGLIGGAAAAGLATFAGLGISAIVQANQATTAPPPITTPWVAPTLPMTTPLPMTLPITTPQIKARAEEAGSSISPLLIGLLTLLGLCCCLGAIGFCIFMKTRKRSTAQRKVRPPPMHEEEQPLVHAPAPPPQPSGHWEQPMMYSQVPAPSYVPATTVMPTATVGLDTTHDGRANMFVSGVDMNHDGIPDLLQQPMVTPSASLYAPATTYAPGSMYGPSSVYAPAGVGGAQLV